MPVRLRLNLSGVRPHPALWAEVPCRIPAEADSPDRQRNPIEVLLHVVDGYLDEIEVVRYRDDAYLPELTSLRLWVVGSE
jgi:hypothetical protein